MHALFRSLFLMICVAALLFWGRPGGQNSCSNTLDADLIRLSGVCPLFIEGLEGVDKGRIDSRWGVGPETKISFILAREGTVYLHYRISNPIQGQDLDILANEVTIKKYTNMPTQVDLNPWVSARIAFKGTRGINTIIFRYKDWNYKTTAFIPQDSRRFAVNFTALQILAE